MHKLHVILLCLFISSCETINDNNPVNTLTGLTVINLTVEEEDMIRLFNNRQTDLTVPVKVTIDGETNSGMLRASGAGSRYYPKFSLRVIMNNTPIKGAMDFSLSAQPSDKTYIKTTVASYLYEAVGFPVFNSEPVFVNVNNKNYGIYNFIERININFFRNRNINLGELYKVQFDSRFTFFKENRLEATFDKEYPPDDENYSSLADLIRASDNTAPKDILEVMGKLMDIENYLWYHAVSTIRSDPDSYTNNFYIYSRSLGDPFRFLPWDFDKTFTGSIGFYGYNELIESLLRNDEVFASYIEKLLFIIDNIFIEGNLFPIIDEMYNRLKEYYKYDPYLNINIENEVGIMKDFITNRRNEIKEMLKDVTN